LGKSHLQEEEEEEEARGDHVEAAFPHVALVGYYHVRGSCLLDRVKVVVILPLLKSRNS
jgi:hypothetical protein